MEWTRTLISAANHSISRQTWSTYTTAAKHLKSCEIDTGVDMDFPLATTQLLAFISWLLNKRKVKGTTIEVYLSGLRQLHLVRGHDVQGLRPEIVKSILSGTKHLDTIAERLEGKPKRLPVTINMLKLIKHELAAQNFPYSFKRLVWTICTLNFFGGFRVHETLSRCELSFDPAFTLLAENVRLKAVKIAGQEETLLQIILKSPKEDRIGKETWVDVYQSGGDLCPVDAYKKWRATNPPWVKGKPAFREHSGSALTGRKLNKVLKLCLEQHISYDKGRVSSHSFRSGVASLMGKMGYTDAEIKAVGRWSSNAFETYMKLPRTKRSKMARDIGNWEL